MEAASYRLYRMGHPKEALTIQAHFNDKPPSALVSAAK